MQLQTVFLILFAAILALGLVIFQYYYKSKSKGTLYIALSFLRFVALFCVFLLLINPKITKEQYSLEKANLIILADNTSSIGQANGVNQLVNAKKLIEENTSIAEKFNVSEYVFGTELNSLDSLSFTEKATNIGRALSSLKDIFAGSNTAILMLTDGNQTLGEDYEFSGGRQKFPIYPLVVGDTTSYQDIRIDQVNTNKYAFLKNKYPMEIFVSYQGKNTVSTTLTITEAGQNLYRKQIVLSETENSQIINAVLDAITVGIKNIKISLSPLENERNIANNSRQIGIEVIDEKTNIALVSNMLHPDLGALKKAIESNEQRSVSIIKPSLSPNELEQFDLFIIYQPDTSFEKVYSYIESKGANIFTITGPKTDWTFLNKVQNSFQKNSYDQKEEVTPILNAGFTHFDISDLTVSEYPPVETTLGELLITASYENMLSQRIKGVDLNEPLFTVLETNLRREAILFGENIWKWRVQSYREDQEFKKFDDFISKVILFLANSKPRSRLTLEYENIYQGLNEATIKATYFDETFVFDNNATLNLILSGIENNTSRQIPMLLKKGYYEADISTLPSGDYSFTASVKDENLTKTGKFTILDYDLEKQLLSSNYKKLDRLAKSTNATLYFPSQVSNFIEDIIKDNRFVPIQKSKQNVVSLIDFKILLGIIVAALTAEWFIRKYNGLI
ncbi:vWA domain-containing protein [uncultured Eudoraea sp.]|uniref:vWA domain-containing protein n=1 Tax=uncultured Eudoraea sp. TaxID=1035614 RepID=UPI0026165560|nr:vWA domain-containing protein [uncultured Eudoraea sp.]